MNITNSLNNLTPVNNAGSPLAIPITVGNLSQSIQPFLDNKGIMSCEDCDSKSTETLETLFKEKQGELKNHIESFASIRDPKEASLCLNEAEKTFKTMKNIASSFEKRLIVGAADSTQFNGVLTNLELELSSMRLRLPKGSSVILHSDQECLMQMSKVSKSLYYESEQGYGAFYEPQISRMDLLALFTSQYQGTGGYKSVSIGWKVDKIYNHKLDGMCTFVALERNKEQQGYYQSALSLTAEPSQHQKSAMDSEVNDPQQGVFWMVIEKLSSPRKKTKEEQLAGLKQTHENSLSTLKRIESDLAEKVEGWRFSSVETMSYEDLLVKFKFTHEEAKVADYVIFYHKKGE